MSFDQLSIIVPVGFNDLAWKNLLYDLSESGLESEIILAACQSKPEKDELPSHVQWVVCPQGRAKQLNAGAKHASNKVLCFFHADTRLNDQVVENISNFLLHRQKIVGYFQLAFADDGPKMTKLNAMAANFRSRVFGLPFGDQGLLMNREIFVRMNGFDETLSLGEDLDFVVRLQAAGVQIKELPATLITSARRYQQYGWLKTTFRHLVLTWRLSRESKRRLALSSL